MNKYQNKNGWINNSHPDLNISLLSSRPVLSPISQQKGIPNIPIIGTIKNKPIQVNERYNIQIVGIPITIDIIILIVNLINIDIAIFEFINCIRADLK